MFDVVRVILKTVKRFSITSSFMYGMFSVKLEWYVVCNVMFVVYYVCIVMCEV